MTTRGGSAPGALGDRNDQTRRRNLSAALGVLRDAGPLPRADLTRRTGLTRPSVGAILAELDELGLVASEAGQGSGRVGRPSPELRLSGGVAVLAVVVDTDRTRAALVGLDGAVLARGQRTHETAPAPARAVEDAVELMAELAAAAPNARVLGIGAAVPGVVRPSDGTVLLAPHLDWADEPFRAALAAATGLPALVGNDATLGAVAEHRARAAVGAGDLVCLNGSRSGIGGGAVVAGRALLGRTGAAAELGHIQVVPDGAPCRCGRSGCLETEVGVGRLLDAAGAPADAAGAVLALVPAASGDALAAEADRQLAWLERAIGTLVAVFDPDAVVLAGFLSDLAARDADRLDAAASAAPFRADLGVGARVPVERARLGQDMLLLGAAELALGPVLADPARAAGNNR